MPFILLEDGVLSNCEAEDGADILAPAKPVQLNKPPAVDTIEGEDIILRERDHHLAVNTARWVVFGALAPPPTTLAPIATPNMSGAIGMSTLRPGTHSVRVLGDVVSTHHLV